MNIHEKRERVQELSGEIQRLQEEINQEVCRCSHSTWSEAKYDSLITKQADGFRLEGHGSDVWTIPTGYHDVEVPRWKRVCLQCGKIEYTSKQKTVQTAPDFS